MKNFRGMGRGPRNNRLDFGGDPDHAADPENEKSQLRMVLFESF